MYVDPTGHFLEDQLKAWFGPNWLKKFSPTMLSFLQEAQLGDVLHGNNLSIMFVLGQDGILGAWDLSSRSLQDITDYNNVDPKSVALYRPKSAGDGPTSTNWNPLPNLGLGEGIGNPAYSDPPYEQVYNLGCNTCSESYELPHGWFVGENNSLHVNVTSGPVGSDMRTWEWIQTGLTVGGLAKTLSGMAKKPVSAGPWWAVAGLTVSVVDSLLWDTIYFVGNGSADQCRLMVFRSHLNL